LKIKYIALAVVGLFSTAVQAADEVTAYRPGVGAPAYLSATGRFEVEIGVDRSSFDSVTNTSLGTLVKYGLSDNIGLLFSLPYTSERNSNPPNGRIGFPVTKQGFGDSTIGIKWVQKANDSFAYGVQAVATLPTGAKRFSSNKSTTALTGLVGFDQAGFHTDVNLGFIRAGEAFEGVGRNRLGYSVGISRAIGGGFGGFFEVSGTRQRFAQPNLETGRIENKNVTTATYLAAVTYTVNSNFVVDGSIARLKSQGFGLTSYGVGMSYLLPK
jgi:Putative MetA-pathway of phenol degradation